mmetsp:Transcript_38149/g.105104  ORF Transcript_38149/g.105104 Transcript_38149/m.105104 type:complete len:391 (+) Transcript_38149:203-1375(+)
MGNKTPFSRSLQSFEQIDANISRRYVVGKRIGRGCYGVVVEAYALQDKRYERQPFAIKKILNAFQNPHDAQRTYREARYLLEFSGHSSIVKLFDVMCSSDDRHLYLVLELMDSDLQKALRVKALQKVHYTLVMWLLLRALKYIHSAGIMHRDVKPANVLLSRDCDVKLADFGWARESPAYGEGALMTDYAGSRWYRCPEMLFGAEMYTMAIDMWAVACIDAEIHAEGAALLPGTSTGDMIDRIIELTGKPAITDIFAMRTQRAVDCMGPVPPCTPDTSIVDKFPKETPEFHDFMQLLLQWNPEKRLTAEEAISHPHLMAFQNPDDEPIYGNQAGVRVTLDLQDGDLFSASRYRDQLYAEVIGAPGSKQKVLRQRKQELTRWAFGGPDEGV